MGYKAMINWEKTSVEAVEALIEVKITPQRDKGFDRIAQRIYQYEEVESCYLMSGGYDLDGDPHRPDPAGGGAVRIPEALHH